MKARLVQDENSTKLLFCPGVAKIMNQDALKNFLLSYEDKKHYCFDVENEGFIKNVAEYPGKTLAYVNDQDELVITSSNFLRELFIKPVVSYLTATEFAEIHSKKDGVVKRLCREGRIPGAVKKGSQWLIPKDAVYPQDARFGSRVKNM